MLFTITVVSLLVFRAPGIAWLSVPICLVYLIIKSEFKDKSGTGRKDDAPITEYDDFDWWQDNQGL